MRRPLIALALWALARPAAAQQCHQVGGDVWRRPGLVAGVRLDAAGYRNSSYEGNYEGLAPALTFVHRRISALVLMPAYRISRNGRVQGGVGDLALALRAPVPAFTTDRLRAGFGLAATFPTGDPGKGLGMGHVMLMPDFWWNLDLGPAQLGGTLGFGRALARAGTSEHQHGPSPLVNPMNMSELEASIYGQARVHPRLAVRASAYAATPVGTADTHGRTRVIASQGVVVNVRDLEIAAELQLGLAGQPFLARGVLQLGYRFDLGRRRRPR